MPHSKILVVEDEEDILELIRYNLVKEGYQVKGVTTGEEGMNYARSALPDLILLDLMLPGLDGLDICRILKSTNKTATIPIIMLTAKSEDADIVTGLELGADDYVTKPFSIRVLIARIRNVLRRNRLKTVDPKSVIRIRDLVIDPIRHEVIFKDSSLDLTATEFSLLYFLAKQPGWVFTRNQIIDAVKGEDYSVTERAVDVQIVGLRKKLGDAGSYVETVRGVGYRVKE